MGQRRNSNVEEFGRLGELEPLDLVVDVPQAPSARDVWAGHHTRLVARARERTGDDALAQSIVRETFAKALPKWDQLVDPVAVMEQRVMAAAESNRWASGGEANSFRSVEEQTRRRHRQRRGIVAAAVGVVGVTALVTSSLTSSNSARPAASPTTRATTTTTRGATVGSVLDAGVTLLAPSKLPDGYVVTTAYRTPATAAAIASGTNKSDLVALNLVRGALIRVRASAAARGQAFTSAATGAGVVVKVGANVGDLLPRSFGSISLVWTDRVSGIDFTAGSIGLTAEALVTVVSPAYGVFESDGSVAVQLPSGDGEWRVIDLPPLAEPSWTERYEIVGGQSPGFVDITARPLMSEIQLLGNATLTFGGVPSRRIRNGRTEFWFERASTGDARVDAFIPIHGVAYIQNGQSIFVASSGSAQALETTIDSLATISTADFDAVSLGASSTGGDSPSITTQLYLTNDTASAGQRVAAFGSPEIGLSCVILFHTNTESQSCGQGDATVWAYAQQLSSTGQHAVGGLVSNAVASIRVVANSGETVAIPIRRSPTISGGIATYYAELPASMNSDIVEFLDVSGVVIAQRAWLGPRFISAESSADQKTFTVVASGIEGVSLQLTPVKFVDGSQGQCVAVVAADGNGGLLEASGSSVGCGPKPVNDAIEIPESSKVVTQARMTYEFTIVPSDAATVEMVYLMSPPQPMTIVDIGLHRVATGHISETDLSPIALRYRALDGRVVATKYIGPTP